MNNSLLNVEIEYIKNTNSSDSYDSIKLNSSPESNTNTNTRSVINTNIIYNPCKCLYAFICFGLIIIITVIIYAIIIVLHY